MRVPGFWLHPHAVNRIGIQPEQEKNHGKCEEEMDCMQGQSHDSG